MVDTSDELYVGSTSCMSDQADGQHEQQKEEIASNVSPSRPLRQTRPALESVCVFLHVIPALRLRLQNQILSRLALVI